MALKKITDKSNQYEDGGGANGPVPTSTAIDPSLYYSHQSTPGSIAPQKRMDWTSIGIASSQEGDYNDYKMSLDTGSPYISPTISTPGATLPTTDAPVSMSNEWADKIKGILADLETSKFKFDLNGEELYQQYRDQYLRNGRLAMMDTMGQAAGLTGGYGSTYSQNAGQQAYQGYVNELNNVVPDVYNAAYTRYQDDISNKLKQYQIASDMYDKDYENQLNQYKESYAALKDQYENADTTSSSTSSGIVSGASASDLVKAGTHTYGPNGELIYIGGYTQNADGTYTKNETVDIDGKTDMDITTEVINKWNKSKWYGVIPSALIYELRKSGYTESQIEYAKKVLEELNKPDDETATKKTKDEE